MTEVHPTALVDAGAELDADVRVGPYSVIGPHVRIGAGTTVGAHCVIEGRTTIGPGNRIFNFVALGGEPQDKKYGGEPCELVIGARNTIREFCTFHIGTPGGGGITRLGDDNWIMSYVHLAHDCRVGSHTILANGTQLAGHVEVGDWAILGGVTLVHQFVRIGAHAFTAINSVLVADLPPFVMAQGQPAQARSMNFEGLRRRGFSAARINTVKAMHKALFRDGLTLREARERLVQMAAETPEAAADVNLMTEFLDGVAADRGIVR